MAKQQRLEAAQRQARVMELVQGGYTFREIATEVGYTNPGAAHHAFKAALRAVVRPAAEDYLEVELGRLDAMLKPLWPRVMRGALKEQAAVLRLMERRAALLGLDAPARVRQEVTGKDGAAIQHEVEHGGAIEVRAVDYRMTTAPLHPQPAALGVGGEEEGAA
jgi:hypothetical protein